MTILVTSGGDSFDVRFSTRLDDFEDPAFFRVRDDKGRIVRPDPEIYGEIIAAQTAFFLAKTAPSDAIEQGLLRVRAVESVAQQRAADLRDSVSGQLVNALIGITTDFANPVVDGVPTAAAGIAGVFASLGGALESQFQIRATKGASAAYEGLFVPFSRAIEASIENQRPKLALLDGRDVRSEDVLNAWLGVYDATFVAPGAQQILKAFETDIAGVIEGLDDPLGVLLDGLGGVSSTIGATFFEDPETVLSGRLADKLSMLANTATRRAEAFEALLNNDSIDITPYKQTLQRLVKKAEDDFSGQLTENSVALRKLGEAQSEIAAVQALLAGFDAFTAQKKIESLKAAILASGRAMDELVGDARLSAVFGTQESRSAFVDLAARLPLIGAGASDSIIGADQSDVVKAGSGDDTVATGAGDDQILGEAGDDLIDAGAGNDLVLPGSGDDTITTGSGRDVVAGNLADLDGDTITDISPADRIEFSVHGFVEELASPELDNGVLTFRFSVSSEIGTSEETVAINVGDSVVSPRLIESSVEDAFSVLSYSLLPAMRTYVSRDQSIFTQDVGQDDPEILTTFVDGRGGLAFDSSIGDNLVVTEDERFFTTGLVRAPVALRHEIVEFQPGDGGADILDRKPLTFADGAVTVPGLPNPGTVRDYVTKTGGGLAAVNGELYLFGFGGVIRSFSSLAQENFAHFSRIDMETGNLEPIRVYPFVEGEIPIGMLSMDYDPATGRLLGLIKDPVPDSFEFTARIVNISTTTGEITTIANLNRADFAGIDPDRLKAIAVTEDGQVIGTGSRGNALIDLVSGDVLSYAGVRELRDALAPARTGDALDVIGGNLEARLDGAGVGEFLFPSPGQIFIDGRGGNDFIFGGAGDEIIKGGDGDDDIRPGLGRDQINGGAGSDTVRGVLEELNEDRIFEFGLNDLLVIEKGGFPALTAERVSFETGSIIVNIDGDGDGAAEFSFTLEGDFPDTHAVVADTGGTLEISLAPFQAPPKAVADAFSVDQEVAVFLELGANDTGPGEVFISRVAGEDVSEGSAITFESGATAFIGRNGLTYLPSTAARQAGEEIFDYQISDGLGGTASATVTLNLSNDNQPPAFGPEVAFATPENSVAVGAVTATDPDSLDLFFALADGGADNSLFAIDVETGAIRFLNAPDFEAPADQGGDNVYNLSLSISDGQAVATQSVTVSVTDVETEIGANAPPAAEDDSGPGFATQEDTPFTTASVLANDQDEDADMLVIVAFDAVSARGGAVSLNEDGTFDFAPASNLNGADSFTYRVSDGNGGEDEASVTISVTPVNDAPVAENDSFQTDESTVLTGPVLGNDADLDGDDLSVVGVNGGGLSATLASGALVTMSAGGVFSYDPNGAFLSLAVGQVGADSFTYAISDGAGGTDTATVAIRILGLDDTEPPVAPNTPTEGPDSLTGGGAADRISALGGNDVIRAGGEDDTVLGGAGDDRMFGQRGNDRLVGQAGNDFAKGNGGDDFLKGGGGDDTLIGGGGGDLLRGNGGDDSLKGGGGADDLKGGGGGDTIIGNGGDDDIKGGGGDDVINGGRGDDTLTGNGGDDTFQFRRGDGSDLIKGFQQGRDQIEISAGVTGFDDLDISQDGRNVLIAFADVDITISNAQRSQFDEADFILS